MKKHLSPALILTISFILVIVTGTGLLMLPVSLQAGQQVKLIDALFTATTSTCVTGLLTVSVVEKFSFFGKLVILLLIQIGGLGLMTLLMMARALFTSRLDLNARDLIREAFSKDDDNNITAYLKLIVSYTFFFEGLGFLLLLFRFYDHSLSSIFNSLFLSISAFCNAGIDLFGNTSLQFCCNDIYVNLIIESLIVVGGLGFVVWLDLRQALHKWLKKKERLSRVLHNLKVHTKLVLLITLFLNLSGAFFILLMENTNVFSTMTLLEKLNAALFNSVTLRTAGFASVDYNLLRDGTKLLMVVYMLIGASPGGTAGGFKTTTFFIGLSALFCEITGQSELVVFNRRIDKSLASRALALIGIYLLLVLTATIVLVNIEDFRALDVLFETASALATVGLSTGITAGFSSIGKFILVLLMFIGRVSPLTTLVALHGKEKNRQGVSYPAADIILG